MWVNSISLRRSEPQLEIIAKADRAFAARLSQRILSLEFIETEGLKPKKTQPPADVHGFYFNRERQASMTIEGEPVPVVLLKGDQMIINRSAMLGFSEREIAPMILTLLLDQQRDPQKEGSAGALGRLTRAIYDLGGGWPGRTPSISNEDFQKTVAALPLK